MIEHVSGVTGRVASRRVSGKMGGAANGPIVGSSPTFIHLFSSDFLRLTAFVFSSFFFLLFGGASIATPPFTGADECVWLITRAVCVRNEDNVTACAFVQRLQVDFL